MALLRISGLLPFILATCLAAGGRPAEAHTGNRLRLGYRSEPELAMLARLTEVYVEEVSGYSIDLREYRDASSLAADLSAGRIDLLVESPEEPWLAGNCAGKSTPAVEPAVLLEKLWGGRGGVVAGLFAVAPPGEPCRIPALVISRPVATDLAYYTLPAYLAKVAAAVSRKDLEGLLAADPAGTSRKTAREWLAARRLI